MSDAQPVPTHPVAPRVKDGAKTPHIGPDIAAYKAAHSETVGDESDEFWAKVRMHQRLSYRDYSIILDRSHNPLCTGIVHSALSEQVDLRRATSFGSRRGA